eukprot:gene47073-58734_t
MRKRSAITSSTLRGRPVQGEGVARDDILAAALALLDEGGGQGLTMRALATRLGVTPMSLYRHVEDRAGLLRALSDRVYAGVLEGVDAQDDRRAQIRAVLLRYHEFWLHPFGPLSKNLPILALLLAMWRLDERK